MNKRNTYIFNWCVLVNNERSNKISIFSSNPNCWQLINHLIKVTIYLVMSATRPHEIM